MSEIGLVDAYALGVANTENYRRAAAAAPGDNTAHAMKSVVVDPDAYDWEGDAPLQRPANNAAIYEMHVRGFTQARRFARNLKGIDSDLPI